MFIIEFFTFNTQINADYLYIYNTSNNVNNLVSTLTGVYPPGSIRDITKFYYASSLSFKFITDDAVESLGWNCSVTLAATPSKCSELNYTALPLATPASVSFSTETQEYNLCSWRFAFDESTAPSPADLNIRVTLTFSAFDIGNSDRVYLYNGGTNELIASLSGNYTSSLNSISYSGYMRSILIRFEMPGGRLKPTLWNATVLFESVGCKNGLSHVDLTPFVPYTLSALNYLNNQNCQWNFTSSSVSNWSTTRYLLTAEVLQFKTEPQDYFSLSSPNSLLWKVSGSSTVSNKIFNFNGTGLLAMFTSDSFNTNTGASIRFTLAPAGSACTVANSNTTTVLAASNSKTIGASVNRTHVNYCTYNFVVAPAVLSSTYPYRTTVNFTQFDIADTDSVTIFDTSLLSTTTTPAFIVSLSGNYTSTLASLLTVLRHSQFTVQFYSFIKSNMTTSASNAWSALITTTQFGCQNSETRIQLNTTGQLASIQVVDYDIYQTCGWRVFGAAEGVSLFKIQFSSFNTRYFYDSLAVYNVTDALGTLNLLSSLSGDYNPSSAALSLYVLGTAVLKFTTQHITAATEYGWKANITLLSCSTLSQCENCMNCKFGTCNFQTGVCQCSPGFTGPTCSNCASGRYGPNCEPLIWPLSVTPSSGKDTGGTLLTVVGDNFANSSNWVCQFTSNTTLASVTVPAAWLSSTSISCVTPVNVLSGGATLRVSSDGGATFAQPVLKFLFTTVCNSTCSGNGVCLFESCRCNTGFYGSSCNLVLVLPSISVAKTEYTFEERTNIVIPIVVASGTQPFTWSLVSTPASNMIFNSTSASVVWTDIPASRTVYSVTVTATNALGSAQAVFSIRVLPLYTSSLRIAPNIQSQTLVNPPPQLQSGISLTLTGFLQLLNTSSSSLINLQLGYNLGIWIYSESTGISDLVIRIPKDSNWQATVTLSSAAAGRVVIGVRHPSVLLSEIVPFSEYQVELNVLSMRMSPADVGFRLYPGEVSIYKNSFAITNPGNTTLTAVGPSLTLGVSSPLQYVNITRADGKPWPVVIPPNGGQVLCDVSVFSLGSWYGSVHVEFNSSQGAFAREFIRLDIVNRAPQLGILYRESSNIYNMVLVRGAQLIFNVKIQNNGDGETFPMNISLPTDLAEIASVSSPASGIIPSILPGGNTILTFFATTPADYPISQFSGSIALVSNITYLYVPISLSIVSQYSVNFTVVVQDEFSFYAEGLPNLEGATVQLSSSTRGISVSYITGSDGLASFLLPEGLYDIYVTAPSHASYSSAVYVSFGSLPVTIFISRQVVKYSWTVTPTVFEDKYTFTLDATFVTSVPMPVIVVRPVAIDLDALETGLIPVINFVFENQGLIQSNNIRLTLPSHPSIQFSSALSVAGTLVIDIGPLAANSTITFPVYVSRVTGGTSRRSTQNCLQAFLESFLNCGGTPQVTTTLISFYRDGPCSYGLYSGEVSPVTSYVNFGSFGGGSSSGYSPVGITGSGSTTVTPAPVLQLPCDVCLATAVKCAAAITGTGNAYLSAASDSFGALISNSLQPLCASVISGNAGSALTILLGTFISSGTGPSSVASSQQTYSSAVGTISTCYYGIYDKCSKINGIISEYTTSIRYFTQQQQSRRATDSFSESGIKDLLTGLGQGLSYFNLHELIFGSASDSDLWLTTSITSDWKDMFFSALSESSSAGSYLSSTEFTNLVASSPLGFSSSNIQMFLTRINNTLAAWETGRAPTGSSSGNFISYEEFLRAVSIFTANCFPLSNLFTTVVDASNGLLDANRNANAGVCASVKIRIVQELVLLREAFDAHLELTNDGNLPLTNISVTVQIVSTAGVVATESFVIRKPDISGSFSGNISNLAMGATLPANSVGDAHWLIAALREAAPTTSTVFKVGGTLTYVLDGQLVVIPLFPAAITVQPDPILWIDYFLEKNVFGDDPFTLDVVEPSIPYTLGLIITNTGFGSAYKLKIQSSQPSIIENERGLLINFKIIGSQIGNSTIEPTLDAALGDIAPHSTKVVRWLLTTSLMGQFVSYNASFENVNPFGEKRLCIVDSLRYHELIHAVRMEYPTDDFLIDYLANDIVDQATTPDFVYSSANGSATNPVMNLTDIFISNVETVSVDMIKVTLTVSHVSSSLTNNYVFGKVNFPPSLLFTPRFTLTKTTRNDGKVLLTENSWDFWKVNHLRSGDSIDAYISVFDYLPPSFTNSTLSYIIYYTRNGYIPPGDQEGSSAVPVATTSKIPTAASSVISSSATSKLTSASTSILAAVSTSTSVVAASSTNLYSSSSSYSSSVFSTIKSTTAAVPDVSSTGLATVAASLSTTSIYSSAAQQTSLASAATLASLASQASLASAASASSDYLASARSATSVVAVALASASAQSVASAASVASLASIASVVSVESVASVSASAASAASASSVAVHQASLATAVALASLATQASLASASSDYIASSSSVAAAALASTSAQSAASVASAVSISAASVATQYIESTRLLATHSAAVSSASAASVESVASVASVSSASAASAEFAASIASISSASAASVISASAVSAYSVSPTVVPTCIYPFVLGVNNHCKCSNPLVLYNGTCITACPSKYFASSGVCLGMCSLFFFIKN